MTESTQPDRAHVTDVLRASHARLVAAVDSMDEAQATAPSYDSEWSIAQVLSHLGSGAEIFSRYVAAGRDNAPPPEQGEFPAIWDSWNAKSPIAQVRDAVRADAAFIDLVEGLPDDVANGWQLDMFGTVRDLTEVVSMRLAEHAIHTWDVVVMSDRSATVAAEAVDLLVDRLDFIVQYTAKPTGALDVAITTDGPSREFRLVSDVDTVTLHGVSHEAPATLALSAEALVRLVYGRLDDEHADGVAATGVSLDAIRAVFPGP